jgi:zinc transport system permease protein
MAGLAAMIGVLAVIAGLRGSLGFDTPTGPSIALAAALIFFGVNLLSGLARSYRAH